MNRFFAIHSKLNYKGKNLKDVRRVFRSTFYSLGFAIVIKSNNTLLHYTPLTFVRKPHSLVSESMFKVMINLVIKFQVKFYIYEESN